jgi:hypothetical protein
MADKWMRYADGAEAEARKRLEEAGGMLLRAIRARLSDSSADASAPGDAPHKRSGRYRASWASRQEDRGGWIVQVVGTGEEYGPPLEFGASSIGMEPRPHVRPAVEELRGPIRDLLSRPFPPNIV